MQYRVCRRNVKDIEFAAAVQEMYNTSCLLVNAELSDRVYVVHRLTN